MRILVLGDSYCPSLSLRPAFEDVPGHDVTFVDVIDEPGWRPTTASEQRLREYLGSPAQVIAAYDGQEVLVVQGAPVTDAVIAAAPELRLICVTRGGPVNVDIAAATARGIPVVTTPGKNATAVAELTIAAMIIVARRIPDAYRQVLAGGELYLDNYEGSRWYGRELAGHTLGLVGFGQIGRRVASRALAFEMRVLAYDPFIIDGAIREHGVESVGLGALLDQADHLSLHARLSPEGLGMIGAAELARMKPGSFLVNTARHELVDEDALDAALASGHLGGAALDIATPSVAGQPHRLLRHANVILLPHLGGATTETIINGGRMAAAEIERFAAGHALVNVADRSVVQAGAATTR